MLGKKAAVDTLWLNQSPEWQNDAKKFVRDFRAICQASAAATDPENKGKGEALALRGLKSVSPKFWAAALDINDDDLFKDIWGIHKDGLVKILAEEMPYVLFNALQKSNPEAKIFKDALDRVRNYGIENTKLTHADAVVLYSFAYGTPINGETPPKKVSRFDFMPDAPKPVKQPPSYWEWYKNGNAYKNTQQEKAYELPTAMPIKRVSQDILASFWEAYTKPRDGVQELKTVANWFKTTFKNILQPS